MSDESQNDQPTGLLEMLKEMPLGTIAITFTLGWLSFLGFRTLREGLQQPAPIHIQPAQPTATSLPTATPEPIQVFINGEVNQPGVYTLPHDAILQDVLLLAGGFSADAYQDVVNLAQPLADGMQVHVPSQSETVNTVPVVTTPPLVLNLESGGGSAANATGLVNLNLASKVELESLPGVGPSTAQKILDYREDNGPFASVEDVMNVSGIGPAKFESMAEFVTVDG